MKFTPTALEGPLLIEPRVFADARGFFFESFNARDFREATGLPPHFVQDNHSRSSRGVVRGLHYQLRQPQGKLVRVVGGRIFDVAVDLRRHSPGFGRWVGFELSEHNQRQLWIPPGFAHGFLVLSDRADVLYKATDHYAPEHERTVLWNDPALGIEWPALAGEALVSPKDQRGLPLAQAEVYDPAPQAEALRPRPPRFLNDDEEDT